MENLKDEVSVIRKSRFVQVNVGNMLIMKSKTKFGKSFKLHIEVRKDEYIQHKPFKDWDNCCAVQIQSYQLSKTITFIYNIKIKSISPTVCKNNSPKSIVNNGIASKDSLNF